MTVPAGRHVLAVLAHPRRDSFTGAVLDAFTAGLREAGHEIESADLYRERFDPCLRPEDYAQFDGRAMPADVRAEQARVGRAEALVFAFPVWWWSMPAMLKGWIDRVWSEGWAYSFEPGRSRGLLADRPTQLLCVAGSRERTYRKYAYDVAMRTQLEVGMFGYCGIRSVEASFFYEVDDDAQARPRHLETARRLGREFLAPGRAPRRLPFDSDRVSE
jgi:NAD(P)H dehydrogenase (quinone)